MHPVELIGVVFGSGAFATAVQWLVTRGKTKRELQGSDIDLSERWDRLNNERFSSIQTEMSNVKQDLRWCQRRCDKYSELTLDLIDSLAYDGTDVTVFRKRYRDIRDIGRND